MTTCYCSAPAPTGYLCPRHEEQLREDLRLTPGDLADLEDTITGQARQGGGGSTGERHVFNETASYAADDLRYLLRAAAHDADPRERHVFAESDDEMAKRALGGIQRLLLQPGVQTTAQDLRTARAKAEQCIDRAPERRLIGVCECGAPLATHRTAGILTCRTCEREHDVAAVLAERDQRAQNIEGTPTEIAAYLTTVIGAKLSPNTVRLWASRGLIHPTGDRGTAKLYRVGEVMVAWEMMNRVPLPGRPRGNSSVARASA